MPETCFGRRGGLAPVDYGIERRDNGRFEIVWKKFSFEIMCYFAMVIGIPTFSILPTAVWNKTLRSRKVVLSHIVSLTE
jgi:hypothetical protein